MSTDTKDIAGFLERTEFFRHVSDSGKNSLARIVKQRPVKKRDIIFVEGEDGRSVFILAQGSIQLFKTSPEGRNMVIKTIEPGEIFAEVILFEKDHYPASAQAVQNSLVYEIRKKEFRDLLDQQDFRNDFISGLMKKMRYLTERMLYLTLYDVDTRFFRFLRDYYGEKKEYEISLSKKDIAAAIGTNPETLSRLILRLKQQGVIEWERNSLRIRKEIWDKIYE